MSHTDTLELLNKTPTSKIAEVAKVSKSFVSQVKQGKRPPSKKLIECLKKLGLLQESSQYETSWQDTLELFIASRREGTSPNTIYDYRCTLSKAISVLGLAPTTTTVNVYLKTLLCSAGGKYGYFKCIRAFFNLLYSPRSGLPFAPQYNPVTWVDAPKRPQLILPSLTKEDVELLIDRAQTIRDKAIIALLTESGLRLSELANIKPSDIDWSDRTIHRTIGKGRKEALAPFGGLSEGYLKAWLAEYNPNGSNIWNLNKWGITSMLRRLEEETGLRCNPHTFRRTFACLLRKAGLDVLTIKDLGRWESLEIVQRYTRSATFNDSLKFYKAPLSQ